MGEFDPYLSWLDISPHERPVNHYRLLGLRLGESDPSRIADAAQRTSAQIRRYQSSSHAAEADRLLEEVEAARACLLNVESKASYDAKSASPASAEISIPTAPPVPGAKGAGTPDGSGERRVGPAPPPPPSSMSGASSETAGVPPPPPVPGSPSGSLGSAADATGKTAPGIAPPPPAGEHTIAPPDQERDAGSADVGPPPPSPPPQQPPGVPNQGATPPVPTPPVPAPPPAVPPVATPVARPISTPAGEDAASSSAPMWAPSDRTGKVGKMVTSAAEGGKTTDDTRTHTASRMRRRERDQSRFIAYSFMFGMIAVLVGLVVLLILVSIR